MMSRIPCTKVPSILDPSYKPTRGHGGIKLNIKILDYPIADTIRMQAIDDLYIHCTT
jgi:hypothetical protein